MNIACPVRVIRCANGTWSILDAKGLARAAGMAADEADAIAAALNDRATLTAERAFLEALVDQWVIEADEAIADPRNGRLAAQAERMALLRCAAALRALLKGGEGRANDA